ncbi:hypothetical protein FE257_011837 [Aspergillus nanangensis]|uniref:DNA-directed DNA polymerase n=1 Tax=Aspergillus nanangensis TaxID=2582783 RepID=A0AAD4CVD0_ASPNN|nr:hypothetical protein FE257_011837 [Aspergillus nanangensis]
MKFTSLLSTTLLLAATGLAVPTPGNVFDTVNDVFSTTCSAPRDASTNPNCWGDSYNQCVALQDQAVCVAQCREQPAGECSSGCTLQVQKDCDLYCSPMSSCEECMEVYQRQDSVTEDQARELCSSSGDGGRISQKKRAALELRSRGIWTEEILVPVPVPEPPAKRRHVQEDERGDGIEANVPARHIDLSTETESEADRVTSTHESRPYLKRPKGFSPPSPALAWPPNTIRVIKLEWLQESLNLYSPLPLDPYTIYEARKITHPGSNNPSANQASDILQRARQDASPHATSFPYKRRGDHPSLSSPAQRSLLHRQTTPETDEPTTPLPPAPDWVTNRVLYACQRSAPLHPPNEGFISQLLQIRKIRELTLDEIGVRAYSTSIAAIAAYPYALRHSSQVLTLPGCESKIATLFAEYQHSETGVLAAASALHTDPVLSILNLFTSVWGIGAKTARDFYYTRGHRDLDDIIEHDWSSLSRVQQIGLKYHDELAQGIPRREVEEIARVIHRHANKTRPNVAGDSYSDCHSPSRGSYVAGVQCILVGGYRRGKDLCGDVDVILTHPDESVTSNLVVDVISSLEAEGWVTHTLALNLATSARDQQTLPLHGDSHHFDSLDKALVVWQDPSAAGSTEKEQQSRRKNNPNPHRRVDIIVSPWRTVGCAVLGWTGDTTFERDLRRYAKKVHGWKFDSSGIRERTSGGQVLDLEGAGRTWEERERLVMEGLGLEWREPGERCSR